MIVLYGTIFGLILTAGLYFLIGPYSVVGLLALIFGLVLANYYRNKEIHMDIQLIKEKLEIKDREEFDMSNEDIEKELEQYAADHKR